MLVSAPTTPGINHRAVPGAVDGCGGMDLLSPGLAAALIVSIFDVCSVRSAAPFIG
jgi:hypothetical protein